MSEAAFWRRTPPALFPVCLGALGLGLAWRQAAIGFGVPELISEILLIGAEALFAVCFLSWLAKIAARPSVILDDLKVVGARAAVSAGSMALLLLASVVQPVNTLLAVSIWWVGLAAHLIFVAFVIRSLIVDQARAVWPILFLPFVGQIVAPISGVSLGYVGLSSLIFWVTLPIMIVIMVLCLHRLRRHDVPVPLRASYVIPLAPLAIFGLSADALGYTMLFSVFFGLSLICAVLIVMNVRWLTKGGWSPGWGAFTFPSAAFAALCSRAHQELPGLGVNVIAWGALVVATPLIFYVVFRTLNFWRLGKLATATGAGVA